MSIDETLERLKSARADHKSEAEFHLFILHSYTGTGGFQGKIRQPETGYLGWAAEAYSSSGTDYGDSDNTTLTYLDKFPREDTDKFKRRKDVAHYLNYVAPIYETMLSYVVSKEMHYSDEFPEKITEWKNNVDGKGTPWEEKINDIVKPRTALLGYTPILIDLPKAEETRARAKSEPPRLIPLIPSNILDWQLDEDGNFEWVKLRLSYQKREDALSAPTKLEIYQIWRRDTFGEYVVTYDENGEASVEESLDNQHSFGEVPIVSCRHLPIPASDDPVRGISMVGDIAIEARRLFNLCSELDEHLRQQVFALLQVPVNPDGEASKDGEVVGGTSNAVTLPWDADIEYKWVAPPQSVAETYEKRIIATIMEIYRIARLEFSKPTGAAVSGISKRYEFDQTNRRLKLFAKNLARAEQQIYKIVGKGMGISDDILDKIRVTPPTEFGIADISEDLENAIKAVGLPVGPTAIMQLVRRMVERLLPNLSEGIMAQIDEELEKERVRSLQDDAMSDEINSGIGPDEDEEGGEEDEEDEEEGNQAA